jgi:hypothetical protein
MRPKISPMFLSQLVEQTPGRVRKRLDSEPNIAEAWSWNRNENVWTVQANEESVRLQSSNGVLTSLDDVSCSCLMSPKCFHILACCSSLPLEQGQAKEELAHQEPSSIDASPTIDPKSDNRMVEVSDAMRASAILVRGSISALLRVGARNAGLLLQSGLLRAGHSCRASDLYALSNTLLRIAEGVQRIRQQSDEADSLSLKEDVSSALFACHSLLNQSFVPKWIVGQSRRIFESLAVRKLNGIFAEPILTRSGFSGVSVYLQDTNEGGLYTVNELRTGDTSLIRQAYRGGIDLGGITLEAKTLCRSTFAVQELTVSEDGRLGKGKSTRWAIAKREQTQPFSSGRFANSIDVQIERTLSWLNTPNEQRPGGWDVVALTATVMGSYGATVVVDVVGSDRPWRLGIMIDSSELEYRHNLELIARCPRLQLRCLVRARVDAPYYADLLAIANIQVADSDPPKELRLELPEDWEGICNTGLDRLERHSIRGIERWSEEIALEEENDLSDSNAKYTAAIERRLLGMVLGGRDAIPILSSKSHRRDSNQLKKLFLPTGAYLLDLLATKAHEDSVRVIYESKPISDAQNEAATAFLVCDTYNQTTNRSLTLGKWKIREA